MTQSYTLGATDRLRGANSFGFSGVAIVVIDEEGFTQVSDDGEVKRYPYDPGVGRMTAKQRVEVMVESGNWERL